MRFAESLTGHRPENVSEAVWWGEVTGGWLRNPLLDRKDCGDFSSWTIELDGFTPKVYMMNSNKQSTSPQVTRTGTGYSSGCTLVNSLPYRKRIP